MFRIGATLLIICVAVALSACRDDATKRSLLARAQRVELLRTMMDSGATPLLTPAGEFRLEIPSETGNFIGQSTAIELAAAFTRTHVPAIAKALEEDRLAPVALDELRPCRRVYFADSPYEPISEAAPAPLRRYFGPWWIVQMCTAGGERQISVAVSALAEVRVVQGALRYGNEQGEEFRVLGVRGSADGLPPSPESAAIHAAQSTSRLVASAPKFLTRPRAYPQVGVWRFILAAPLKLQMHQDDISRDTVYVGYDPAAENFAIYRAAPSQEDVTEVVIRVGPPGIGGSGETQTVRIRRKPTYPVNLVPLGGRVGR